MQSSRRRFLVTSAAVAGLPLVLMPNTLAAAGEPPAGTTSVKLNVRDFGATGDSVTKDTLAFQQAIDRANAFGGAEIFVPQGDYLIGSIVLHSNVHLHLDAGASLLGSPELADYPLMQVRWEGRWVKGHSALITATDARNMGISGTGRIVGNPTIPGRLNKQTGLCPA